MPNYEHTIKDPVHGHIGVTEFERCIISTGAFQRLRRILQLPTAVYVYPGAVHTRFIHSIGAMHIAGVFGERISSRLGLGRGESDRMIQFLRAVLLLHDIGHGPFSHSFEENILYPMGTNHEILGSRIVNKDPEILGCFEDAKDLGFTAGDVSKAIASVSSSDWPLLGFEGVEDDVERGLFYVLKGPFAADLLDYLVRDSYYTGAGYGLGIDWARIARNVAPLPKRLGILEKAIDVYEHVLVSRYHMFAAVYYHKTTRAVEHVVSKLLEESRRHIDYRAYVDDPSRYVELDDYFILGHPGVRSTEGARMLLSRRIPYTVVEEKKLQIPRTNPIYMVALNRRYINSLLFERLGEEFKGLAYIDTPHLPLNPMLRDEEVLVVSGDRQLVRRFDEMSFGTLSYSVVIVRLYMDKNHLDKKEVVVKAFREIVDSSASTRSFY